MSGLRSGWRFKLWFLPFVLLATLALADSPASAAQIGPRYGGIEFYGSSQVSKQELEKIIGLKPGASLQQVDRAVQRLKEKLAFRHVPATVQVVEVPPDKIFIVVDVTDTATDTSAPTRRLRNPRHIYVSSEKPFLLMDQLESRLERLSNEGRPWREELRQGLKYYTDEPANQIVDQIVRQVPDMRDEIIAVTESDPDSNRRRRAVELLHWAGGIPNTTYRLIPAIDDADGGVRAAVARYMFPRFELLPDAFPFAKLVEAYSRQINRPTHQDRTKGLYCLLAIAGQRPDMIDNIQLYDETRIKKLAEDSTIPTVKDPAQQLLAVFAKQAAKPPQQAVPPPPPEGEQDAAGF